MGAFTRKEPIVVGKDEAERKALGWDEWESITIKASACTEDFDAIAHADKVGRSTQMMLQRFVIDWTLLNEQMKHIDVTPEALALLETPYLVPVIDKIGEVMQSPATTPAQLQNFTKAATKPSSVK